MVFFENTLCVNCGHLLAFLPSLLIVGSLDPAGEAQTTWTSPLPAAAGRTYHLCANYRGGQVCNWAVDDADDHPLCVSCRLTQIIPDLSVEGYQAAWYRLEVAKRRLLYTLLKLGLPFDDGSPAHPPLVFRFLSDFVSDGTEALTGHADGVITVNVAEAYDAERERRRHMLGEPYRTILGHMRHEVGHYYWTRLIAADKARLERFRQLFGDDRQDYAEALKRHYETGPPADWQDRFVTAYASAHAWEDWAETWAHYLHMSDTMETAAACGLSLRPSRRGEPALSKVPSSAVTPSGSFDRLINGWHAVTYMLNSLNRGMGLADAYPFVLAPAAIEKLRFVHEMLGEENRPEQRTGDDATVEPSNRQPGLLREARPTRTRTVEPSNP